MKQDYFDGIKIFFENDKDQEDFTFAWDMLLSCRKQSIIRGNDLITLGREVVELRRKLDEDSN